MRTLCSNCKKSQHYSKLLNLNEYCDCACHISGADGLKTEEIKISPIRWETFGKGKEEVHMAFDGDKIIGIVSKAKDFPCEAFGAVIYDSLFISSESAKEDIVEEYKKHLKHKEFHQNKNNSILSAIAPALKAMLDTIEKKSKEHEEFE